VGLIPTTELNDDGQSMLPSVSVPNVTAAMFAAAATPDPVLDPHGSDDRAYGFCSPSIHKGKNSQISGSRAHVGFESRLKESAICEI
jgi:hypothetical protein